jgi:hypothetical protein
VSQGPSMQRRDFLDVLGGAAAFRKGLNETGHVEGQNVTVEYHWLEGQYDRLPATPPIKALRAFQWFLGENGLRTSMANPERAAASMGFIQIDRMRTKAQNRCFRILSVLRRFAG